MVLQRLGKKEKVILVYPAFKTSQPFLNTDSKIREINKLVLILILVLFDEIETENATSGENSDRPH